MAKQWTDYQRRIADAILAHRADTKAGYDFKAVKDELGDVSQSKISETAKALRENSWVVPAKENVPVTAAAPKEGGKIATVVAKQPAPVIFSLGTELIELEPGSLYESYLLYKDMKAKCSLDDGFASVIRDGVGLLWQILVGSVKVERGKITMEVTHGGSTGEGETGVRT